MNPASPLDSVVFIALGDNFKLPANAFAIDPSIPLPVQKASSDSSVDIGTLTQEQIFAGILTVLAYDTANANRRFLSRE